MEGLGAGRFEDDLFTLCGPRCVLKHDAIAIGVFECATAPAPVRVEWLHFLEAGSNNQRATLRPFERLRQVKNQEVFWRWRRLYRMSAAHSEFKMHCCSCLSHHCSVEAVVISEGSENGKSKASAIHFD